MKKIAILLLLTIPLLSACSSPDPNIHTFEDFSISYPPTFDSSEPEEGVTTIQSETARLEIFTDKNRIHGFSSSSLEEFEWKLVPKEEIDIDNYRLWLFYHADDAEAKEQLKEIIDSFKKS